MLTPWQCSISSAERMLRAEPSRSGMNDRPSAFHGNPASSASDGAMSMFETSACDVNASSGSSSAG